LKKKFLPQACRAFLVEANMKSAIGGAAGESRLLWETFFERPNSGKCLKSWRLVDLKLTSRCKLGVRWLVSGYAWSVPSPIMYKWFSLLSGETASFSNQSSFFFSHKGSLWHCHC
jgi:hypothetical protein